MESEYGSQSLYKYLHNISHILPWSFLDMPYKQGLNRHISMEMNVLAVILGGFRNIGPVIGGVMEELSTFPVLANSSGRLNYQVPKEKLVTTSALYIL
jgi:hypothetical protein